MPRSMLKFFRETGGPGTDHGGKLHWPGTVDGFPYRGEQIPDLRGDEIGNIPLALDYKSGSFRLWIEEEKVCYDVIMDRIVNGWFMQHRRFEKWIDEHCGLYVWLEWVQIYGETAAGKVPGSETDDTQAATFPLGQVDLFHQAG